MHRFFTHPKTKPGPCGLRCCGNKFAHRIPRSCNRKGHTAQRMRRYVRHVEEQAVHAEIAAAVAEHDQLQQARIRHRNMMRQLDAAGRMMAALEARLFDHYAFGGTRIHDEVILDFRAGHL